MASITFKQALKAYDPSQARADDGKWTDGGVPVEGSQEQLTSRRREEIARDQRQAAALRAARARGIKPGRVIGA